MIAGVVIGCVAVLAAAWVASRRHEPFDVEPPHGPAARGGERITDRA
ncbi:MAG: hypothetical protein K2W96_07955 [Gemmataceae bacterium]|nr:hypothetical protein [Gemmataceae bacterium]